MAFYRNNLTRKLPLPPGWSEPEIIDDCVDVGGVAVYRAGVSSRNGSGLEVTGSAAERDGSPLWRAWLELLERMAIVESGVGTSDDPRRRPARSNGVAAHATWTAACAGARLELVERDRVLRSWYGELAPVPVPAPELLRDFGSHEWVACVIPGEPWSDVEVAVVVGFPADPQRPLARGFAARSSRRAAVEAASREALQGLAFLWDEPVPECAPAPAPTPIFHLDYYLYPRHHQEIRRWLAAEHGRHPKLWIPATPAAKIRFVDLTHPALAGQLAVAQAGSDAALPLVFGDAPVQVAAGLPRELHVHPIA